MNVETRNRTYNFAYLDEQTKRMIRRAILKAIAIPGYQVPFASREMPMPYGWGTGGVQVTAAIIGMDDVLKVIDQGADDTTNAVSIRKFFQRVTGVETTTHTGDATIIQTRHRIPEEPLKEGQVLVYQVGRQVYANEDHLEATDEEAQRKQPEAGVRTRLAQGLAQAGEQAPGRMAAALLEQPPCSFHHQPNVPHAARPRSGQRPVPAAVRHRHRPVRPPARHED